MLEEKRKFYKPMDIDLIKMHAKQYDDNTKIKKLQKRIDF